MREGQAAGDIIEGLPNKPEIRFALVPLTDGEYLRSLQIADQMQVSGNEAGILAQNHRQQQAIIAFSAREIQDFQQFVFTGPDQVGEALEHHEVNFVYDRYLEMVANNSPSLYMLSDEEIDNLKKAWERIGWNELSGSQQYAAMRFLLSIRDDLLQGSFSGSLSTSNLTQTSENEIPASPAEPSQKDGERESLSA